MDRKNRPSGRSKRVGTGSGSVKRRSSSPARKSGGRVGGGYTGRKPGASRPSASQSFGTGTGVGRPRLSLKSIIIIAALIIAAYFFLKGGLGGGEGLSDLGLADMQTDTPSIDNNVGYTNTGAYDVNTEVSDLARGKRTIIQGGGDDVVTLMIYMIGTDLESRSGMATADISEIVQARISDKVNIIIQTGGTKQWKNNIISPKTNQRYRLTSEGLLLLEEDLGKKSMVDPTTLSDFIAYSRDQYPADRYELILWDHGGGSQTGFGYDELFPGEHMTLDEIGRALDQGNTVFDLIGFDACLMGTLETAMVLEPYADYMIASEELEPGIGWYYTDWISALSDNTSIPTTSLGKKIIDDYVAEVGRKTPKSQATLSLIDLAEMDGTVPEALRGFAMSTNALIDSEQYTIVSNARSGAKEFAKSSKINQIDLIDFAQDMGTDEALVLVEVLRSTIKYNRTSDNISNANGVSIYFPYSSLSKLGDMLDTYDDIGMDDTYAECVRSFGSMAAGGQLIAEKSSGGDLLGTLLGQSGGSDLVGTLGSGVIQQLLSGVLSGGGMESILGGNSDWLNGDLLSHATQFFAGNQVDALAMEIIEKNGEKVLIMSEEQWSLVQTMEQNVFIDDGSGFIDLGLDNTYEWNEDGDLIMTYDGTWIALNGNVVSYYMISDDHNGEDYTIMGRIPALLNDERVDIMLQFDQINEYGTVLGAQIGYDPNSETATVAKGLIEIMAGDRIDFLCDYYTYEGAYTDTYYLGDAYTATGAWTIENLDISQYDYEMSYRITDIYGAKHWTPVVSD